MRDTVAMNKKKKKQQKTKQKMCNVPQGKTKDTNETNGWLSLVSFHLILYPALMCLILPFMLIGMNCWFITDIHLAQGWAATH